MINALMRLSIGSFIGLSPSCFVVINRVTAMKKCQLLWRIEIESKCS